MTFAGQNKGISVVVVGVAVAVVGVVVVGVVVVGVVVVDVVVPDEVVVGFPQPDGQVTKDGKLQTHTLRSKTVPGIHCFVTAGTPDAECRNVLQESWEFGSYIFPFSSHVQDVPFDSEIIFILLL